MIVAVMSNDLFAHFAASRQEMLAEYSLQFPRSVVSARFAVLGLCEPLALAALATGLEVMDVCCFVFHPMLIRGSRIVRPLAVTEQVESSAPKPAAKGSFCD